jgi:hypothetical protein
LIRQRPSGAKLLISLALRIGNDEKQEPQIQWAMQVWKESMYSRLAVKQNNG